jgi:hypothetical protein
VGGRVRVASLGERWASRPTIVNYKCQFIYLTNEFNLKTSDVSH